MLAKSILMLNIVTHMLSVKPLMEILQGIDSLLHSSQAFQCPLLFAHPGLHILAKDLVLLF
jgi:hypothetical protein